MFYHLYGTEFLFEAFLHHASRRDPRHNFSSHFYFTYLHHFSVESSDSVPLASATLFNPDHSALVCTITVVLALAIRYRRHLEFCWLLTTLAFVAFNKVCTAQYFVWYFGLLPLCLTDLDWGKWRVLASAGGFWIVAQLHWLGWAYLLEFQVRGHPLSVNTFSKYV